MAKKFIFDEKYEVVDRSNSDCSCCDFDSKSTCEATILIEKIYGIDCISEKLAFKRVGKKTNCTRDNIKVGDIVYGEDSDEEFKLVFIYKNVDKVIIEETTKSIYGKYIESEVYIDCLYKYDK